MVRTRERGAGSKKRESPSPAPIRREKNVAEYTVKLALKHDKVLYPPESTVELTDEEAAPLLKLGAVVAGPPEAEAAAPAAASKARVPDLVPPGGPVPAEQKAAK
jgi:hypothetical protein